MELKTLKDFSKDYEDIGPNDALMVFHDLKQEAIKWIKSIKLFAEYHNPIEENAKIEWIKYFFNISDDELK